MTNHTPPPWICEEINLKNGKVYFINHLWKDQDGQTHTDEIAQVMMDYRGTVALDNARLMAAAPDLLEAASHALQVLRNQMEGGRQLRREYAMELLQKAIKKAEAGE